MKPYLQSISWKNFRAFGGEHSLTPVPTGLVYVLGENKDEQEEFSSNGGGKTSVLNLLAWGFYGQTSSGGSKDSIITLGEDAVEVRIQTPNLTIERSKPRGKAESLRFFTPTSGWVKKDLAYCQADLEKELKLPRRIFFAGFWIDKEAGAMQLLLAKPLQRLQLLQEVFSEDRYKIMASDAGTRRKVSEGRRDASLSEAGQMQYSLRSLQAVRAEMIEKIRAERQYNAYRHRETLRTLRGELTTLQDTLNHHIAQERATWGGVLPSPATLDGLQGAFSRLQIEMSRLENALRTKSLPVGMECPECSQTITADATAKREASKSAAMLSLKARRQQLAEVQTQIETHRKQEQQIEESRRTTGNLRQEVERKQQELLRTELDLPGDSTVDALVQQIEELDARMAGVKSEILVAKLVTEKYIQDARGWGTWEQAFGPKGIPSLLLERFRSRLTNRTCDCLQALAGSRYKMQFPPAEGRFDIEVQMPSGMTELEPGSGGERWRFNLGLILGFRKALQDMYPTNLGFVCMDDVWGALDEVGEGKVQLLAEILAEECPHVFIAVPRDPPGLHRGSVVRVEKFRDRSRIVSVS